MALRTTPVRGTDDIREFFDRLAPLYRDCHGRGEKLLGYRLSVIERMLGNAERGILLEIGCGTGLHLFALAASFRRSLGTDLSPAMIEAAERLRRPHPLEERIALSVDPAEVLASVADGVIDVALCVGALEHMPDKLAVLRQARRVLRPDGVFLCLTPNADYLWYSRLARWMGLSTRHLSSDRFLSRSELPGLLADAGLALEAFDYWTFVPRGDMPAGLAGLLDRLDWLGHAARIPCLRGGICFRAGLRSAAPAHRSDG